MQKQQGTHTFTPTQQAAIDRSFGSPATVRLREALTLDADATDAEVAQQLSAIPTSAACDGCRHGYSDGRGHNSCNVYHPAWDIAEELGLADASLDRHGWAWTLHAQHGPVAP